MNVRMMDNSDDINLVSLPGAEATEPTTILEELNRNFIEPVVAQVTEKNVNENEHTHDLNNDNDQVTDVGKCNKVNESNSDVIEVNKDNEQIVHSDKLCDSNQNEGIENLNFTLQTIEDTDDKLGQAEIISEVNNTICEEIKNCDEVQGASVDLTSDNLSTTHGSTGKLLREASPPPVPLVTYRWEDVRRDKQKVRFEEGGYPWTYLDPHEPRVIVLNKESKEDEQDKEHGELKSEETKDLEEIELNYPEEEDRDICDSIPEVDNDYKEKSIEAKKTRTLPNFLKRVHSLGSSSKKLDIQKANQSPPSQQLNSPTNTACCHPFVEKLKTMADKQLHKAKQYRAIKKHPLQDGERIDLNEPQKILKLKESPKADRKEIASYIVKQDSDDVLEIVNLDESPSEVRRHREEERSGVIVPDEIIELPLSRDDTNNNDNDTESVEPTVTEILESDWKKTPPPKSPRKRKDHVYEDIEESQAIDSLENDPMIQDFISHLSLRKEDDKIVKELADKSEDEGASALRPLSSIDSETDDEQKPTSHLLAPISSIDSTSDDEKKLVPLPGLEEESEEVLDEQTNQRKSEEPKEPELKSLLKREASPSSDKKVTFSDDNLDEPHREDVDLPEHVQLTNKWSKMRIRSSSMGATPHPKKHFTSRAESTAKAALDVRCACQFFQSDSLLPERVNPVGSRPSSSQGYYSRPISPDLTHHVFEPDYVDPESQRRFSFGVVTAADYYSESISSRPNSPPLLNSANKSAIHSQQHLNLSSDVSVNIEIPTDPMQKDPVLLQKKGYQSSMDTLRQKDPSTSVLLRRRSESTQKNLENVGKQRDPSTSSILRRRFSEQSVNNVQQGSLNTQSSIEEPVAKEPKLSDSTQSSAIPREAARQPATNAERFMLSKNTLQMKPSIGLSDLYRDTMTFGEQDLQDQPKPKTIDVGIIDLMSLGMSFIQKGEIKEKKKSKKDKKTEDETPAKTEDVEHEPKEELETNTKNGFSSPTSSALVHIGQNIYIEEPGQHSNESDFPHKNERLSRRDYPAKKMEEHQNLSDEMPQEYKKTKPVEVVDGPVTSTLLPRDLREQSTFTVDNQKIEPQNIPTISREITPFKSTKQRDVSTSSLLQKRYNENNSFESPHSTDQQIAPPPTTPTVIKQRDPSTSSLLRKRYRQSKSMEDHNIIDNSTSNEVNNLPEPRPEPLVSSTELSEGKIVSLGSDNKMVEHSPASVDRDKMDWIQRTYNTRDHEYEPIGEQSIETVPNPTTSTPPPTTPVSDEHMRANNQEDNSADASSITSHERKLLRTTDVADEEQDIQDMQDRIEERFLAPTPQTDHSRNDEICTSQVDSSAIEDLPLRREDRKKGFMASTTDKTRNVQRKLSKQADRLKSKFKEMQKPKPEESPKSERKRFRSPEFNKLKNMKMPKISKPELKRPEFTKFKRPDFKFNKPDMAFLKKYDGFSSLRLNRKKSNTSEPPDSITDESKMSRTTDDLPAPTKKRFDFSTYPRLFDRMRRDNRSGGGGTTISRDTEASEECDRISGPMQFATVPRSTKDKSPIRAKWSGNLSYADDESSSGKFKHYSLDRESSIEKRMRLDFNDSIDIEEGDQERNILQTDEQRQYADYDEENRAIHEISKAKESEFRQRKPLVHQESDVVSDVSNKEFGWVDTDHLRNRLMAQSGDLDISQKEEYVNDILPDKDHLSTQETQSSGSSSNRRRKGVIEEIDDDEFFLRKKGISQDDIQIGRYISAAIREGLDTPVNALAQLGQYDSYYDEDFDISNERVDFGYDVPPRKPRRVRDFEKSLESGEFNEDGAMRYNNNEEDDDSTLPRDAQFFQTYPPSRPRRKARKEPSDESHDEHAVPVAAEYYPQTDEDDHSFYENKQMEGIEQPDIKITYNEETRSDFDINNFTSNEPPKAPKRRKHLLRESMERDSPANNFVGRSVSNSYLTNGNAEQTVVFRTEHEYFVPLVQPETFTTPTPTPRSRSKASPLTDDDRTSRGAESLAFDDTKFSADIKEINGYAVVKKEPPPRPPAPVRRKRSTRSLGDRQFFTMPLRRNQNDGVPERPVRNYSTIGPTRPARRVSLTSLEKPPSITSDATQYEEIEDHNHFGNGDSKHKTNQSYKMKHRPLPPPPRPPRERKHRKSESDGNKLDKDGGGEKITTKNVLEDISRISSQDMEEIEEMERSTQTDPLPDDYLCEEFDINSDMPIIEPSFSRHSKTLEDILKEEQQAELERARQIADENSLSRGIHKFREANQRSLSERSRGSTNDRPKTPSSRPLTPSAVLIEKKVTLSTVETDAQLIVQPIDVDTTDAANFSQRNRFFAEDTVDTEDERIVNEALKRYNLLDSDFRDSSPVSNVTRQNIELNIREVEPVEVPREELPAQQPEQQNEVPEKPPQAPPRRKSSCTESTVVPSVNENENATIPEERTDIEAQDAPMNLLQGNRLHINELEVEHLNVHALQAGRILVSDLQAIAISSQDIECTSGDLTVKGIKLPPGFLEELINRARVTATEDQSRDNTAPSQLSAEANTQQSSNVEPNQEEQKPPPVNETLDEPQPPARPPPPRSLYPSDYPPYSLPPPSFYQLRAYPDEVEEVLPHSPTSMHRRRRYHRRRDSTSEEEEQREHRRSRQHSTRSPEPSISDLSGQLVRACGSAIGRTGVKLYSIMKEKKQEMKRRDITIGVAILIFIVAFLMMIGMGERTVHHHHWDYINPPDNPGRN